MLPYNVNVNPNVKSQLIEINIQFYQTFAAQFSATRQRIQPGVRKALLQFDPEKNILDVGCGNGNLWQALIENGYHGQYVGIDFSAELIRLAKQSTFSGLISHPEVPIPDLKIVDFSKKGWDRSFPHSSYDIITVFAVLHHIPDQKARFELLKVFRGLLEPRGKIVISVWQFLNSSRLRSRIVDWEDINIPKEDVDPGDYLLDWRSGGFGLRYIHLFDEAELKDLASQSGFNVEDSRFSDGAEGNLGLYQTWSIQD